MIVRFGRGACPSGFLPAFSVNSVAEARKLLAVACLKNIEGEYVSPELAEEQTIERLFEFAKRLEHLYGRVIQRTG